MKHFQQTLGNAFSHTAICCCPRVT